MKLKQFLRKKRINLNFFAKRVGCKQPHISLICAKKRRPSPDLALKIEQATDGEVTAMELLYPERN